MNDKYCRVCNILLTNENWWYASQKQKSYICDSCSSAKSKAYRDNGYKPSQAKRDRDKYAQSQRHQNIKQMIMKAYGGKCECCGENEMLFLSVDHINCDGAEHRR